MAFDARGDNNVNVGSTVGDLLGFGVRNEEKWGHLRRPTNLQSGPKVDKDRVKKAFKWDKTYSDMVCRMYFN